MQNPDQLQKEAWDILNTNISALENGGNVDLSVFDSKVKEFCDCLATLPATQAKKYQNTISEFIDKVNSIKNKLESHRDSLEAQINSLNQRNTAYNAYGNAIMLAAQSIPENEE